MWKSLSSPHWGPGIPTQDVGNILVASQKMFPLKCIWRCGRPYYRLDHLCVCGWCCKSVTIASWRPESFHTLTTIHRSQNPHGDRAEKHSERERLPLQCCTYQCHVYLHYSRVLGSPFHSTLLTLPIHPPKNPTRSPDSKLPQPKCLQVRDISGYLWNSEGFQSSPPDHLKMDRLMAVPFPDQSISGIADFPHMRGPSW